MATLRDRTTATRIRWATVCCGCTSGCSQAPKPPGEELPKPDQEILDELRSVTGAMICGRRLYEITHGWNGSHPFGAVPTFVVTHSVPDTVPTGTTSFTFLTQGIVSAVAQAKDVAGAKDVYVIGGASIHQQLLDTERADELRIDLVPVLTSLRWLARITPCSGATGTGGSLRLPTCRPASSRRCSA